MKATEIDIAGRLRELRKKNKYTQDQVATAIDVKRSTYGAYEEGRSEPSIITLRRLATFYRYESIEQLLGISLNELAKTTAPKSQAILAKYFALPVDRKNIVDFILGL